MLFLLCFRHNYQYTGYHKVSLLYGICQTKGRALIGEGYVGITDPNSMQEIGTIM